jgi:hypothetical protein
MNKPRFAMMIACVLPILGGCEGVKLANTPAQVNLIPPAEMRHVVPAGPYKNDLTALVGTIAVYNKGDNSLQVLETAANPYDPRTRPVVEAVKQTLYKSLVDQSLQTDIPVVAAAVKDAAGQVLEVTITDEAHAMVPRYSADVLHFIGSRYHPTSAQEEIVYVTEAWLRRLNASLLTRNDLIYWTKNAPGAVAYKDPATMVYNNQVYVKQANFKDDLYLTVSIVPMSKIAALAPGQSLEAMPASAVTSIKPQIVSPQAYIWGGWGYGGWGNGGWGNGGWGWNKAGMWEGYKPSTR